MPAAPSQVTALLDRIRDGDKAAEGQLYEIVMPQLRRLAQHLLGGERSGHTLQGTELVHQMYLRLSGSELSLRDRAHFFAIAARAMRRELIDHARCRPGASPLPLEGLPESVLATADRLEITLAVDELLDRMRDILPQECSIVELKIFFGLTDEETAEALAIPLRSMQAKWQDARIWLYENAEAQQWKPVRTPKQRAMN
jgi:RNA polymerase sigma factor (TIGR02999 family)